MPGLDSQLVQKLNTKLALKRIGSDISSDFILTPHYSVIYKHASVELSKLLSERLSNGKYNPMPPITIEVVKKSGTTRPGSILNPIDRLLYQCLIDEIAPIADNDLDRSKVFSNQLSSDNIRSGLFKSANYCYTELKIALEKHCKNNKFRSVLVTDIACYFERIYQHVLINLLRSTGVKTEYINILELYPNIQVEGVQLLNL